jgi:quinol monooxygenase YgiN
MIIVAGTFDVDPGDRDTFLESRRDPVARTRTEAGCVEYAFSADALDPGRVRLFELWESKDHLRAHLQALQSAPPNPGPAVEVKAREIKQYEISAVGEIGS